MIHKIWFINHDNIIFDFQKQIWNEILSGV